MQVDSPHQADPGLKAHPVVNQLKAHPLFKVLVLRCQPASLHRGRLHVLGGLRDVGRAPQPALVIGRHCISERVQYSAPVRRTLPCCAGTLYGVVYSTGTGTLECCG